MRPQRVRGVLHVGDRIVEGAWIVSPGSDQLVIHAPEEARLPTVGEDWEARGTVSVLHTSDRGTAPIPVEVVLSSSLPPSAAPQPGISLTFGEVSVSASGDVAAGVRALDAALSPARLRTCATCRLSGQPVGIAGIECGLGPSIEIVPAHAWCDGYERASDLTP